MVVDFVVVSVFFNGCLGFVVGEFVFNWVIYWLGEVVDVDVIVDMWDC